MTASQSRTVTNIESIVRGINRELVPTFEEKLRAALADKDRDWLVEQVVRLSMDNHALEEADRRQFAEAKAAARRERLDRVRSMTFGTDDLQAFLDEYAGVTRESLIESGHLRPEAPVKGTALLTSADRTEAGEELLTKAKDVLFVLLFGDQSVGCDLARGEQELLTLALPRFKAGALDFMRASTELTAAGTWQDPDSVSNDERADNVLLEVQFGEVEGELVGNGIVTALTLINNLEVNEQVLYARMINVEETSLIL